MPRHTIYLPDELDLELRRLPGKFNISGVCAAAIRAELSARTSLRSIDGLFTGILRSASPLEIDFREKFRMRQAIIARGDGIPTQTVATWTGLFLNETLFEGMHLALGGGTQIWEIARRLEPRNLGVSVWALGFGHVDRETPHLHPNALATLVSMLYGTRTKAMLVGAPRFEHTWSHPALDPNLEKNVRRMIVGSCAMFDPESPYAKLLGDEMTDFLIEEHVMGDFLGVFIGPDGRMLEPYTPAMTVSHIGSSDLQLLSKRDDTLVVLAAGGRHKVRLIRQVLELGLCNAVVTDASTASALL